jgi:hypothetical protein
MPESGRCTAAGPCLEPPGRGREREEREGVEGSVLNRAGTERLEQSRGEQGRAPNLAMAAACRGRGTGGGLTLVFFVAGRGLREQR